MLSERARHQWTAYAEARAAAAAPFGDRDELHRFLVGIHLRGELLPAPELRALLDEAGLEGSERDEAVTLIDFGLALLAFYDRLVENEDGAYVDAEDHGFRI